MEVPCQIAHCLPVQVLVVICTALPWRACLMAACEWAWNDNEADEGGALACQPRLLCAHRPAGDCLAPRLRHHQHAVLM